MFIRSCLLTVYMFNQLPNLVYSYSQLVPFFHDMLSVVTNFLTIFPSLPPIFLCCFFHVCSDVQHFPDLFQHVHPFSNHFPAFFTFKRLFQPHFPTIFLPFFVTFPAFPPFVSPIGQVYTPFRQGQLRAERLADRRHRGLAAGKQVKARGGESLSTVQKKGGIQRVIDWIRFD